VTTDAILQQYFPGTQLKSAQSDIVKRLLQRESVLAILPTGFGKSLCFQLPALCTFAQTRAYTLVLSPLLALMADQVSSLRCKGIAAAALNSSQTIEENVSVLSCMQRQELVLLYLSPEMLQSHCVRALLTSHPPWLVVVDEAHCVSQWGEAFRPAYRKIQLVLRQCCPTATVFACTATASPTVEQDIVRAVFATMPYRVRHSILRSQLFLGVQWCEDFMHVCLVLQSVLAEHSGSTLMYLPTRQWCDDVAALLQRNGHAAQSFHAGKSQTEKAELIQRFHAGAIRIMCCTTAFGMGIDIPHIRMVIHLGVPESLGAYLQECGRAGRDGQPSACIALLCPSLVEHSAEVYDGRRKAFQSMLRFFRAKRHCRWQALQEYFGERSTCLCTTACDYCQPPEWSYVADASLTNSSAPHSSSMLRQRIGWLPA
jgi:ATP-dependent DNA helicase RecQ